MISGNEGSWYVKDGGRETPRGTIRQKTYMMYVIYARSGREPTEQQQQLRRLINLSTRTRPRKDERDNTGYFTPGPDTNRIIKDGATIVQAYGAYILRMSHETVQVSDWLLWNDKIIDTAVLKQLIEFELDPDTLKPLEAQPMHKPRLKSPTLFDIGTHDLDEER